MFLVLGPMREKKTNRNKLYTINCMDVVSSFTLGNKKIDPGVGRSFVVSPPDTSPSPRSERSLGKKSEESRKVLGVRGDREVSSAINQQQNNNNERQ